MRNLLFSIAIMIASLLSVHAQYAPPAGEEGSTAIHSDSSVIVNWASDCIIERGLMDISQTTGAYASYGFDADGSGVADNVVVSLGDGGSATLAFENPIRNGTGPDFAVFENTMWADFLELCFVEVSSDNISFHRFPAISLSQTSTQVATFGSLDATKLYNLGGKYEVMHGVPFDLEELASAPGLDVNNITHVRLVDVVGCIDSTYASFDADGNIVNDPWPTNFESSGFDLDAVGVIHESATGVEENQMNTFKVYPQPANSFLIIENRPANKRVAYTLFNTLGNCIGIYESSQQQIKIDLSKFETGLYHLQIEYEQKLIYKKVIISK